MLRFAAIVSLTLMSGYFDARGFVHASRMWSDEGLVVRELVQSAAGFALGVTCYWIVVRLARLLGVVSAEAQALGWFAATAVGVAIISGEYSKWHAADRALAVVLLIGLATLQFRTAS